MAATKRQTKGSLKASGILYLVIGIVCVAIGILILACNAGYMIKGECLELEDYFDSGVYPEGEYVSLNVNSVLGTYAETKHTTNGIPTGKDLYYVLFLDDNSFISLKVKDKGDIKKIDKICDDTWASDDWCTSEPLKVTGKLKTISNSEIRGFYGEFFDEFCSAMGITRSDLESEFTIRELDLDITDSRGSLWGIFAILCGIGVIAALVGLASLKKAKHFEDAPAVDYSNVNYTPVDTSEYNPVDTGASYDQGAATTEQDPNNFQ